MPDKVITRSAVATALCCACSMPLAEPLAIPVNGPHTLRAQPGAVPGPGITRADALAATYDSILNAEFSIVEARLAPACTPVPVFCDVLRAVSLWWQIALEPENKGRDAGFLRAVGRAVELAEAWTTREPQRAEAWFARGSAYAARAQFRTLRDEHLSAARDGARIRQALERALVLDPTLHDANFGLGLYRYYAAVAPAGLRFLRVLLLLPGGDRQQGLQQLLAARERGAILRGEADYQVHFLFLWYEQRHRDALAIVRDLQRRYPHNPLFRLREGEILDEYLGDRMAGRQVLEQLLVAIGEGRYHAAAGSAARARHLLETRHRTQPRP